jgi:hypothetical protein
MNIFQMGLLVIALIILMVLFLFYSFLIVVAFIWGLKIFFSSLKMKKVKKHSKKSPNSPQSRWKTSLLAHDLIGILLVFSGFALISFVPDRSLQLNTLPFLAALIPYSVGFFISAGVGIHCGVIGTIGGLLLIFLPEVLQLQVNPFFNFLEFLIKCQEQILFSTVLIGIANISGWLGGFAGAGQIKDSKAVAIYDILIEDQGSSLEYLISSVRESIGNYLGKDYKRIDSLPKAAIAEIGSEKSSSCTILSFEQKYQWRFSYAPILEIIKSLFSSQSNDMNTILDYVSNLFRHQSIDIVLKSKESPSGGSEGCGNFHLAVMAYMETPGIIWVNEDINTIMKELHISLRDKLEQTTDAVGYHNPWSLISYELFITRYWQKPTRLEQYVKKTPGSKEVAPFIHQTTFMRQVSCGGETIKSFSDLPTRFDRIRGTTFALILFISGPVGLGILVNWLSEILGKSMVFLK